MSAARPLAYAGGLDMAIATHRPRTSLIDAEWEWIARQGSVEPTPSFGFQSSNAPDYVPTLGKPSASDHVPTLKMPLPLLTTTPSAPDITELEPPQRAGLPRQKRARELLAHDASEASQTLKSVTPARRRWTVLQLGVLVATTLSGFAVGYGVLFALSVEGEPYLVGNVVQARMTDTSPALLSAIAPIASVPSRQEPPPALGAQAPEPLPAVKVRGVAAKRSPGPKPRAPRAPKRAIPTSDNPY